MRATGRFRRIPRGGGLALLAAGALALHCMAPQAMSACTDPSWLLDEELGPLLVAASATVYLLAMAVPFVPGIEIGLALMLLLGESGIVLVYLCTQAALALSFAAGRLLPPGMLERALGPRPPSLPAWLGPLQRRPGIALAALINLPGNAVVGGAGGIGMLAGMSRKLPFWRYALLMAAATTPVPLALLLLVRL